MELYRILPLVVHLIILLRFGYDMVSLNMGLLSRPDLIAITSLYDTLLYVLFLSGALSVFIKEGGLRLASILTGILAFSLIWFSADTFTPEYHQSPLYVPAGHSDDEVDDRLY